MIHPTGNGASGYQVVESPVILSLARQLGVGLPDQANRRRYAAALRTIRQRLRVNPRDFGEYLYPLPTLRLDLFVGSVAPVIVHYGVHQEQQLVFVKNYQLLS